MENNTTPPFDGCSPEEGEPKSKRLRFQPIPAHEFATLEHTNWLLKSVIAENAELVVIFGPSQSGKTFLTLDMLMAIARGVTWYGHKTMQKRVVYIGAESAFGVKKRLFAYAAEYKINLKDFQFDIIPDCPNLLNDADVTLLAAMIGQAGVVAIDTFSRVIPGGNENDGQHVGKAIAACQVLHEATGAVIILVHHTGKNTEQGARGWSGLKAAVDTEISVESLDTGHVATITKQKDSEPGDRYGFLLDQRVLGQDRDGQNITSCVVKAMDEAPKKKEREKKLGNWEQKVWDAFNLLYKPTINSLVKVEEIIETVSARTPKDPHDKKDRTREYALRALDGLIQKQKLNLTGSFVTKF